MTMPLQQANEFVRRAQLALGDARLSVPAVRAWQALQERDDEGHVRGTLPYTQAALDQFEAAHQHHPENIRLLHHLAVAHHARAWDWELANDERAADEWELALNYWRRLAFATEFWQQLKQKLSACDARADGSAIDKMRRDLLENLLDVQVDFVRNYCERNDLKRALTHVRIVQRAKLPPAIKKRLVDKVYLAMTSAVPEASRRREFDSALVTLDRFLGLFPDYLPGLRLYAEVCTEYLSGLSYSKEWDEICGLSARVLIWGRRLATHTDLQQEALARTALQDLSCEFLDRGCARGFSCQSSDNVVTSREDARAAYEFGLVWARLAFPTSSSTDRLRLLMSQSLYNFAVSLRNESVEISKSDIDLPTKLTAMINLLRRASELLQEAKTCGQEDQETIDFVNWVRSTLSMLESKKTEVDLFGELEDE